jgi:hypothetical protein
MARFFLQTIARQLETNLMINKRQCNSKIYQKWNLKKKPNSPAAATTGL